MSKVCTITVGFQGANRAIKEVTQNVPADWIPANYQEAAEVLQVPEVKRRISVTGTPLYVTVSAPFDDFTDF